jgi:hypothetical protein
MRSSEKNTARPNILNTITLLIIIIIMIPRAVEMEYFELNNSDNLGLVGR